jgi:hypothetical protein
MKPKLKQCVFVLGKVTCLLLWAWSLLAIWYWPKCPAWLAYSLAGAFLILSGFWLKRAPAPWKWAGLVVAFVVVRVGWEFNHPSNDRTWVDYNARTPVSAFTGDQVTIRNVRSANWRSAAEYDLRWEDRTYDLSRLATVEFIVAPFAMNGVMAHTFLTFGFEDGEQVAISVEVRKEQGESYSPVRGFFRHYETIYVVGDETDLFALRTEVYRDPVYLFPIKASREQVRALLELLLRDANELAAQPQWYNTVLNTCHLRIVRHVNTLRKNKIGMDWRNYLPGHSDELAWELGLIDSAGTLEQARERFLIKHQVPWNPDRNEWSRQIRSWPDKLAK